MAFPIFQENGIRNLVMSDLAVRFGTSKATLYKYFKSKDEIVAIAVKLQVADLWVSSEQLKGADVNYFARYFNSVKSMISIFSGLSKVFINDLEAFYPDAFQELQNFREYKLGLLRDYYEEGISNGHLTADLNVDMLLAQDELLVSSFTNPDYLRKYKLKNARAFHDYCHARFCRLANSPATLKELLS